MWDERQRKHIPIFTHTEREREREEGRERDTHTHTHTHTHVRARAYSHAYPLLRTTNCPTAYSTLSPTHKPPRLKRMQHTGLLLNYISYPTKTRHAAYARQPRHDIQHKPRS